MLGRKKELFIPVCNSITEGSRQSTVIVVAEKQSRGDRKGLGQNAAHRDTSPLSYLSPPPKNPFMKPSMVNPFIRSEPS